jgi:hypothetical protein
MTSLKTSRRHAFWKCRPPIGDQLGPVRVRVLGPLLVRYHRTGVHLLLVAEDMKPSITAGIVVPAPHGNLGQRKTKWMWNRIKVLETGRPLRVPDDV